MKTHFIISSVLQESVYKEDNCDGHDGQTKGEDNRDGHNSQAKDCSLASGGRDPRSRRQARCR